jgi:tRNA threonylcarbamoyladenosine biosynthesis protein TsaE
MKHLVVHQLEDVAFAAKEILEYLGNRKVLAFYAPMGAGKTTLISAILRAMGINELEGSPTYSLVNSYHSPYYGEVYHFDVYRIQSVEEALDAGLEEIIYGGGVSLIEWAELIEPILPDDTVKLTMSVNDLGERLIQID